MSNVMVIDDDERTVNTLTAVLNAKGHTVLGVRIHETGCYVLERGHKKPCSLQAAKTYIADNNISVDVIFLDHLMIIGVLTALMPHGSWHCPKKSSWEPVRPINPTATHQFYILSTSS